MRVTFQLIPQYCTNFFQARNGCVWGFTAIPRWRECCVGTSEVKETHQRSAPASDCWRREWQMALRPEWRHHWCQWSRYRLLLLVVLCWLQLWCCCPGLSAHWILHRLKKRTQRAKSIWTDFLPLSVLKVPMSVPVLQRQWKVFQHEFWLTAHTHF